MLDDVAGSFQPYRYKVCSLPIIMISIYAIKPDGLFITCNFKSRKFA
jgi:hypothetical protein